MRDPFDRLRADIDQGDVRAIERVEISGVDAQALATEDRAGDRIAATAGSRTVPNLAPDELGGGVVGGLVEQEVAECANEAQARSHLAWYSRSRSSSVTSRADFSLIR